MDSKECYNPMAMYAAYIKEREGAETIERSWGFAVVRQMSDYLYLQDIYILPEFRRQGKGAEILSIVEAAAKELGYKKILGSCCPETEGATESMKAQFATGFKLHSCDKDIIYLIKDLS